jgi:hypothetical protein
MRIKGETMKTKFKIVIIIFLLVIGLSIFSIGQNNDIVVTKLDYKNSKIPEDFHGYKILHISDLHNDEFGEGQDKLLEEISSIQHDIIVITGDLVDSRRTDIQTAMEFISRAIEIAPIYYVPGNHEARLENYPEISAQLSKAGVHVLENEALTLKGFTSQITLMGISDPSFYLEEDAVEQHLGKLAENNQEEFKILLSHRPELMDLYAKNKIDLVFSGHAHGGQIRLPFIGGLVAPDQGFFPKYTEGMYKEGNTIMVVSRGLGNSIFPIRVFNQPELVVVRFDATNL